MNPLFIGGAQRSGTTMLGSVLGGNTEIVCVPEASFIHRFYTEKAFDIIGIWKEIIKSTDFINHWCFNNNEIMAINNSLDKNFSYRQLIELIVYVYAQRVKKINFKFWVCHTPNNIAKSDILFNIFPDAKFIHIFRDGRAVSNSILKTNFGANTSYYAAYQWRREVSIAFMAEYLCENRDRFYNIRYEDIITKPERELKALCEFINIVYEENMILNRGFTPSEFNKELQKMIGIPLEISRVDSWKKELKKVDIAIIEKHAEDALRLLGYERTGYNYKLTLIMKLGIFTKEIVHRLYNSKRRNQKKSKTSISDLIF